MYYSITAQKDSTIYERSESLNSGLDEILELEKTISSSGTSNIFNSRILIKFDLSYISKSLVNGSITNPTYSLQLYTSNAKALAVKYGIEAFPVSQSWEMGKGRKQTKKITAGGALSFEKEGVSWKYRDGETQYGNVWSTSSYNPGTTGSFTTTGGGCTWFTGSNYNSVYQTFDYEDTDVLMNVTNVVNDWITGTNPNEGFIVLRSGSTQTGNTNEEQNSVDYGTLQFFSTDTHTIYQPRLVVEWDDTTFETGSLSALDIGKHNLLYIKNNRREYKRQSKERFRIVGREKYPTKTYDTVSAELAVKYLPSSSYYSIQDALTGETIVPFNTASTKINCDNQGNYVDLWMDQFYSGRRYKFLFKVISGSMDSPFLERVYDKDYLFKVVR
jgi:hypothetical protein|tara:strand:- start:168 stop:1328 length:1161 start_codon:yes stop_codon:yes gene_type:complete